MSDASSSFVMMTSRSNKPSIDDEAKNSRGGSGVTKARRPTACPTMWISPAVVQRSGPAASTVTLSSSRPASTAISATSSTYTGWNSKWPPAAAAMTGIRRSVQAMLLTSTSSSPNTSVGRTMP